MLCILKTRKDILPTFQVILLMIPNEERWLYLAVEKVCPLSTKNDGDFFYLTCLHLFRTKSKLESHNKV